MHIYRVYDWMNKTIQLLHLVLFKYYSTQSWPVSASILKEWCNLLSQWFALVSCNEWNALLNCTFGVQALHCPSQYHIRIPKGVHTLNLKSLSKEDLSKGIKATQSFQRQLSHQVIRTWPSLVLTQRLASVEWVKVRFFGGGGGITPVFTAAEVSQCAKAIS